MQNNINNNGRDAFSEVFRQKLEKHEMPVAATCWEEIEARLKAKKRKKKIIPFWFWLSGGAAVASLALLFILRTPSETKDLIGKSTSANTQPAPGRQESIASDQHSVTPQQTKENISPRGLIAGYQSSTSTRLAKATEKQIVIKTLTSNQVQSTIKPDYPPGQMIVNDSIEQNKNATENEKRKENDLARNTSVSKDSVSKKIQYIPNSLVEEPFDEPIAMNKSKNNWLLAATVGSNGSVSTGNNSNYGSVAENSNIVGATASESERYISVIKPRKFSNINYNPPLSVGLLVRKNLDKELSLESGLVYTYLWTTFGNNGVQQNNAQLHLHYIGIPVNLITQVWNNSSWEIYLSAGGMIEKGIRSVYVLNQYYGSQTITTTSSTNINGVQWSVNGAAGATYKIQNNVGIFFEPKISYYFDNRQPISVRTKHPIVTGLTAGVRFQIR